MLCVIVFYSMEILWIVVVFGVTRVSLTLSFLILSYSLVFSIPLCFKDVFLFFQRHVVLQKRNFLSIFGCGFNQRFASNISFLRQ
jgi:hypothetical protein